MKLMIILNNKSQRNMKGSIKYYNLLVIVKGRCFGPYTT